MARAKLSGSLLVRRDAPPAAESLNIMRRDSDEPARGLPVLAKLPQLKKEAEPDGAQNKDDAVHDAIDCHPGRLNGRFPAHLSPVLRAATSVVFILAAAIAGGLLFPQPTELKRFPETGLAAPTPTETVTSGVVVSELKPSGLLMPKETRSDLDLRAPIVASTDPGVQGDASLPDAKVSGGMPSSNLPNLGIASTEPPGSAALNTALLFPPSASTAAAVGQPVSSATSEQIETAFTPSELPPPISAEPSKNLSSSMAAEPNTPAESQTDAVHEASSARTGSDNSPAGEAMSVPAPGPSASTATRSIGPAVIGLSVIEREILVSRGDAMLGTRDVISARLFYQRAADAGDNIAALRLGATFDPVFLNRVGLGPMGADLAKAAQWYRRARDLGNKDADTLLKTDLGLAGSF